MPKLNIKIKKQKPNECLPACLKAVFNYYQIKISEKEIIEKISKNSFKLYDWDFQAGKLVIEKGLTAEIYTNVTLIFDPSWYKLSNKKLIKKIGKLIIFFKERNENFEKDPELRNFFCPSKEVAERLVKDAETALVFLKAGGAINFSPVSKELVEKLIDSGIPIIAHHNPALLHRMKRSYDARFNDIKGNAWGHVIIISGYTKDKFIISDPEGIFYKKKLIYEVDKNLLLESILRYDGQLLIIKQ